MNEPLPSMRCVCGHWDTEHAAFTSRIRPGITRTLCDHCNCRYWMTPEDRAALPAYIRSSAMRDRLKTQPQRRPK